MPITIPKHELIKRVYVEMVEDKDEGGFVVSYPGLPGCMECTANRSWAVWRAPVSPTQ